MCKLVMTFNFCTTGLEGLPEVNQKQLCYTLLYSFGNKHRRELLEEYFGVRFYFHPDLRRTVMNSHYPGPLLGLLQYWAAEQPLKRLPNECQVIRKSGTGVTLEFGHDCGTQGKSEFHLSPVFYSCDKNFL